MAGKKAHGKTASSKPITGDLIDKLAKKAEAGYDVEETFRRRPDSRLARHECRSADRARAADRGSNVGHRFAVGHGSPSLWQRHQLVRVLLPIDHNPSTRGFVLIEVQHVADEPLLRGHGHTVVVAR
jgi:hypothetical protein